MKFLTFIFLSIFTLKSQAALFGEVSGISLTDTSVAAVDSSYTKTYYAVDIYANLETKKRWFAGFHLDQITFNELPTASSEYNLSSQNMGLMLMYLIDKNGTYSVTLGYNLIQTATYKSPGLSESDLSGSGYWATFGIMPQISPNLYAGMKILYYQANYTKKTESNVSSDVSYSRTFMLPILSLSFRY
jgi:hypothetical protein